MAAAPAPGADPARHDKMNVVFILADDLGWADTTLYGHTTLYRTPNLERLAKRGMTFTHAYVHPLCSPTRASIMTGLCPARIGITVPACHVPEEILQADPGTKGPPDCKSTVCVSATRLKTDYVTLAESLKAAGYRTAHFGKWHLGPEPYSPLQQGFDIDVPHYSGPGPAGSYVAPWKFPDFKERYPGEHIEDRMATEALAFMEANKDRPFFLNYWMFSVHAPFNAKTNLIEKYRARINPSDPQRSPTYAAMVESMDDAVGTLMGALDRLQLSDHTIVVFLSDNGGNMYNEVDGVPPTSNAPLRGGKGTLYEGGVRVPCIVCWPGTVAGGSRSDAVIQGCDFYPTLLDMLALRPAEGQTFDGLSIVPALRGQPLKRDAIFTYFPQLTKVPEWLPPAVTVHCGDWKLIRIFYGGQNGAHRWKLFNLANDLGEQHDLAAQEPQRVKELDARIEAFLRDTHAVVPLPNPAFDSSAYHPELEGVPQKKAEKPAEHDPLQGWKARGCTALVTNGLLTVKGAAAEPFLGFGLARPAGPATVRVRLRAPTAGKGKIECLSSAAPGNNAPFLSVPFEVRGGDWQTVSAELFPEKAIGILRVYLPAQQQSVDIDWIEIKAGSDARPRRWNF